MLLLSRAIRRSPDVLVCRLVDGKITYVHRRMWPALVSMAGRFSKQRLAALKEVHTPSGKHKLLVTPFPDWVPKEVLRAARRLTEKKAASQLAVLLKLQSDDLGPMKVRTRMSTIDTMGIYLKSNRARLVTKGSL